MSLSLSLSSPIASKGSRSRSAGLWCIAASLVAATYVVTFAFPTIKNDFWYWLRGDTLHSGSDPMPAIYHQEAGMFAEVLAALTLVCGVIHGGLLLYFDERVMPITSARRDDEHPPRGTSSLD